MNKRHFISVLHLVFAAGCMLQVACGGEAADEPAQTVVGAENAVSSNPQDTGTWRPFGGEFCGDLCGTLDCRCVPNSCPPKPSGKPCSPVGTECFEKIGRNPSSVSTYICE